LAVDTLLENRLAEIVEAESTLSPDAWADYVRELSLEEIELLLLHENKRLRRCLRK
jgi:hypothetical protein